MSVKIMSLPCILSILLVFCSGLAHDVPNPYSISNMSPKSLIYEKNNGEGILQSSIAVVFDKKDDDNEGKVDSLLVGKSTVSNDEKYINNELNDIESIKISEIISPTKTKSFQDEKKESENSFLVKRGRQVQVRPPSLEMSTAMMTAALTNSSRPRQNNPDIQDIITGIVKLLNGNVNVHANSQGSRSPMHNNRINNRGPPRIAEAQVPFNDNIHDLAKGPFEPQRQDAPLRPFLTGVPVPEQIVPSMQQNYRPGFVSQNRPPWRRPKPRPPIQRRPIPAFNRPIPTFIEEVEIPKVEVENYDEEIIKEEAEQVDVLNENETVSISPTITTIIQSTSEVNLVKDDFSLDKVLSDSSSLIESSIIENTLQQQVIETPVLSSVITPSSVINEASKNPDTMQTSFQPRPGIVLDDPEFKPGHKSMYTQRNTVKPLPQNQNKNDFGYGEIFDVTLSAIQGPNGGSQQTIVNVNPYKKYQPTDDVLFEPSGDHNFVSIDGKRTYFNLFSDSTEAATSVKIEPTKVNNPGNIGTGYVEVETEAPLLKAQMNGYNAGPKINNHPQQRPKIPSIQANQPQVRIDTCIIGDDSTCDQAQNEKCRIENGISSCNCKPGYARRKHREICRKIVSLVVSLRIDKYNEKKITWESTLKETSEVYRSLKYESFRAIDSAMSMTPFSDEFVDAKINEIYKGDPSKGLAGVFVNFTIMLEENAETLQQKIRHEIQRHLIGVIQRRNNNIGSSSLFVESPVGSVSAVQDLDECSSHDLNDCDSDAYCVNSFGSYRCQCKSGFKDPNPDQLNRAGRVCQSCSDTFCNNRGVCSFDDTGSQVCTCSGSFYGSTCEIDGEILTVAIGASIAAIIIIILTLVCLIMWSRRWQREHKSAMVGSPVFGYLGGSNLQQKSAIGTIPYQVGLEERIRWAQIADVMAQANHYGVEPARVQGLYPGYSSTLNTMSGHHGHLGHHHHGGTLPPIPLPRLNGLSRSSNNGLKALENSSSSEEEDRNDMLNRNFQVPRPKSRSNASECIYYDVDYLPSGEHNLYSSSSGNNNNQPIPLSTYGRNATYYK